MNMKYLWIILVLFILIATYFIFIIDSNQIGDTLAETEIALQDGSTKPDSSPTTPIVSSTNTPELVQDETAGINNLHDLLNCNICHGSTDQPLDKNEQCSKCHASENFDQKIVNVFHSKIPDELLCLDCHSNHIDKEKFIFQIPFEYWGKHEIFEFSLNSHSNFLPSNSTACTACHKTNDFEFIVEECLYCHQAQNSEWIDIHTENFSTSCISCHDGLETIKADFNHPDSIPVYINDHLDIACIDCHTGLQSNDFSLPSNECISCHSSLSSHENSLLLECYNCHNTNRWDSVEYPHNSNGFPLTGSHSNSDCSNCHGFFPFTQVSSSCNACHINAAPHGTKYGTTCSTCHSVSAWSNINFIHSNQFTDCISCHSSSQPSNHYNFQCSTCHTSEGWKPANFSHSFPMNHEGANKQCSKCHPNNNINSYTCYQCHQSSEIAEEHDDQNNFSNCMSCHPNGQEPEENDDEDDDDD